LRRGGGPDTDNDFGPFATVEERNKLDEIFGEGDHADLLEDDDLVDHVDLLEDDDFDGDPLSSSVKVEDPCQKNCDTLDNATRVFDENETIASLATASIQNSSPRFEEKQRIADIFEADSFPLAESLPLDDGAGNAKPDFNKPSIEGAMTNEIQKEDTLPAHDSSITTPIHTADAASAIGRENGAIEQGGTTALEAQNATIQDQSFC
jgi:hypothetical protein